MTLDEALKEIEILKLQKKKLAEAFDSLDKKYDLLKLELDLAQACHNEKCAEFNKLCFDYAKLQVKNEKFERNMKNVLEIEKKNAVGTATTKIIEHLADLFDCPCNYSFADKDVGEYMGEYCENKYDDNCTCNNIECWHKVLDRWVNEE